MNNENQKKLVDKYPEFFKYYKDKLTRYPIMFGIECGDGWFTLLDVLMKNIQHHLKWNCENKEFYITQIKEKFGGLRFYFQGGDDQIEGMVHFAESFSYQICEICGTVRNIGQTKGWIVTCCKECFDGEKTNQSEWSSNEELEIARKKWEEEQNETT